MNFFKENNFKYKKMNINDTEELKKYSGSILLFLGAGDIEKYIQAFKTGNHFSTKRGEVNGA